MKSTLLSMLLVVGSVFCSAPLLDRHVIPLYGNASLGYYYVNLYVGSPPQEQSAIADTGSGLLALPCSRCTACGIKHLQPPFRIQESPSNRFFTCNLNEQICKQSCRGKRGEEPCSFSISYAEGSSLFGIYLQDNIQFQKDSEGQGVRSVFGCTTRQTNLFYEQAANGIFGLAPKRQAKLLERLYSKHSPITGQQMLFSMCVDKSGGQLVIGRTKHQLHTNNQPVTIRYNDDRNLYSLEEVGTFKLGEDIIKTQKESTGYYGVFIDSGSTFTYLPHNNYGKLMRSLQNACSKAQGQCFIGKSRSTCFKLIEKSNETLSQILLRVFPSLDIELGGQVVSWSPIRYLMQRSYRSQEVCLGVQSLDRFILGANWMVDRDIVFNLKSKSIQIFSNSICSLNGSVISPNTSLPLYSLDGKQPIPYTIPVFGKYSGDFNVIVVLLLVVVAVFVVALGVIGWCCGGGKKGEVRERRDEEQMAIRQQPSSESALPPQMGVISKIEVVYLSE